MHVYINEGVMFFREHSAFFMERWEYIWKRKGLEKKRMCVTSMSQGRVPMRSWPIMA